MLIEKHGVASFKIFMFYGSHGLHGASDTQRDFLMIGKDERYDSRTSSSSCAGSRRRARRCPSKARQISLSLHCETAEIMTAYTKIVEKDKSLKGLAAYSASRPPHSEGLAVFIASLPRQRDGAAQHQPAAPVSSRKAVQAAMTMAEVFPHIDFRREVTIGHLMLDIDSQGGGAGQGQSADPPARRRRVPVGGAARPASSTGSSATTPAAATRRRSRSATSATSGWPRAASAAPSTCCRRW